MVWYVKSRPCHPWRWGRGELVSSSRILWALSGDPETRSEAVIRFRVSGWQGKIATVSFHREEASSNPRLIFHSFCFRVSQPWCCWHLRPGNPFLWVSFVQCKIFSNILASTCWISMCFHPPPTPTSNMTTRNVPWEQKLPQVENHCVLVAVGGWWAKGDDFIIHQGKVLKRRKQFLERAVKTDALLAERSRSSSPCAFSEPAWESPSGPQWSTKTSSQKQNQECVLL